MKKNTFKLLFILLITPASVSLYSQKSPVGENSITSYQLENYVSFLASPLLKGRMNGEEGLEIASQFIVTQAKLIGLKPGNGNSFLQSYTLVKKSIDPTKTIVQVNFEGKDSVIIKDALVQLLPMVAADFVIEGEVVFAGYGINADKYKYNDLNSIKPEGKILLVMDRAPMSDDGEHCKFEEPGWTTITGLQMKLPGLLLTGAQAILFVTDPKSGSQSVEEQYPSVARELKSSMTLKGQKSKSFEFPGMPKIIFIHRKVADELLKGSGYTLEELQKNIDINLKPHSFTIKRTKIKIIEVSLNEEKILNNVAGYIEGRDPVLKNEFVIFSGHMDHIGAEGGKIYPGADDDASGCAALLSMANAFSELKKKPLRSILFLWVSGEEIGLFGSKSYVNSPLFPLEKTVADLNMDMIGRVKGSADTSADNPMSNMNTVFLITDFQSKELLKIAEEVNKKSTLNFNYSLSGRDHPLMLFRRSDHYNFVQRDIPILFFTTGLHTDYHTSGDVIEKLNFNKMEMITKAMFEIGNIVANRRTRLAVDNPFSSWSKPVANPMK